MVLLSFKRHRSAPMNRLQDDLDRIIAAIQQDRAAGERPHVEPLTTAVAALNALMCRGPNQRFAGIQYEELRHTVGDYLDRDAFPVLVQRLAELPITLSLVAAAAKDRQLSQDGRHGAELSELRRRVDAILQRLNRCVLAA